MGFQDTERFQVLRVLGQGSSGVVYEALDRDTQVKVALKTLRTVSPETLFEFKQEFRSLQNLAHPNLIELYDLSTAHGTWFFTMQLVEGVDFCAYVRPGAIGLAPEDPTSNVGPPPAPRGDTVSMGTVAPQWVGRRLGGTLDETRLRACLVQLTRGLMALHESGKVHRDIKPSNMRVTPGGHVVILDFGLATDVDGRKLVARDSEIVGTVAYMAPEQAAGRALTPAADWYSVGVMLFEAMTGTLPLEGNVMDILMAKQTCPPMDPRNREPTVPADLAELCLALLRLDPNERPKGAELLRQLGAEPAFEPMWASSSRATQAFVGRKAELELLHQALARSRTEGPQAVGLFAESGLGKSTLVRKFTRSLELQAPRPLVLEGACDERESMPFRGIDGALDALSSALSEANAEYVSACMPDDAGLLGQFFPVLSNVRAVAAAPRPEAGADPVQLRQRLFEALRRLLANLARRGPLVLVLEDLQWAGGDTWALLQNLFRGDLSPELLLVFTVRTDERGVDEELQRRVAELAALSVKWVPVPRLSADEARALARQLLHRLNAPPAWLEEIVTESGGNPLLVDAMARGGDLPTTRSLDEMLLHRVEALEPLTRRILELVCLSNAPVVQQAVATAAGVDLKTFNMRVGVLKAARLVRATGVRGLDTVEAFQDRLRIAVARSLSVPTRKALHEALASALQSAAVPDDEAMAWHWARAGQSGRAAEHAERAADYAMERLAFDRAARLYGDALAVRPKEVSLHERLGEALVGAGRGAEAGTVFDRAAELSDPVRALELTRRAAHEFMRSGHIDQGLSRLAEVLSAVGERSIGSPLGALVSLLIGRALLFVRGLKFKERTVKQVPAAQLLRIDATWAASEALAPVDVVRGAYLQTRHTILSLRAGEPGRIARSLAVEAVLVGSEGSARYGEAKALHARAVEAAARAADRDSPGYLIGIDGIIEFHAGFLVAANARLREAIAKLQREGRGMRFELANARLFSLVTKFYLGNLKELFDAVPELIHESERLGDRFALTGYRANHCNTYWLAQDDVGAAQAQVAEALSAWSLRGYQTLHYYGLLASVQCALYAGDGQAAHARVRADWPKLERSFLLRVQALRIEAWQLRGRAAWAAGDEADARRCLARLRRERHPLAAGLAVVLEVALDAPAANDALWTRADRLLSEQHLELFLQAVRFKRWAGRPEQQAPRDWFLGQGVVKPEAFVEMLIPSRGASAGQRSLSSGGPAA